MRRPSTRGGSFTEYAIVLITVSIVSMLAIVSLGGPLLAHYRYVQMITGLPVP
jgi:hypothetical protein